MNRVPFSALPSPPGTRARLGRLVTAHGVVDTPQFMPVGTQATVRAQRTEDVGAAGATMLLANTWHLAQRPGLDVFDALGGIHRFMGWGGAVLTDSGGFQVYSLGARVDEDGVDVPDHRRGGGLRLTPESSVAAQLRIGADIAMVLDHCVPSTVDETTARDAMERTHRWARRSLDARGDAPTALFAIVQGACFPHLRTESADHLAALPFDGFAIGGLAVGESRAEREAQTAEVTARLPLDRPRYLMGVGTPVDLLEGVHRGVDLFDCILPTSLAQRGRVYTSVGRLDLRRGVYRLQDRPLDPACACPVCATHSRAYLRHLFVAEEPLAWSLLGTHNLHFWLGLMARIRAALQAGRFAELYAAEREQLVAQDIDAPVQATTPKRRKAPPPTALGRWAIQETPGWAGAPDFASIRDTRSGEVMHAVSAPDEEARRLYVEQPGLPARVAEADAGPLVVWDVGLGAASNAMEVLHLWEAAPAPIRPIELHSFEQDLDALRLALRHPTRFPRLCHRAPHALLAHGSWTHRERPIRWTLREGDATELLFAAPTPSVILWDPFSARVDGPMWSAALFARLHLWLGEADVVLSTYSNATAVRRDLLMAGFFVGLGRSSGPKEATTIAWTRRPDAPLLDEQWLAKWARSASRWPADLPEEERDAYEARLRAHPQFLRGA